MTRYNFNLLPVCSYFLKDSSVKAHSSTNNPETTDYISSMQNDSTEILDYFQKQPQGQVRETSPVQYAVTEAETPAIGRENENQPPRKLMKKTSQNATSKFRNVSKLQEIAELSKIVETKDQYTIFGDHIVSQLRELPIRSFIILQEKIQSLITRERLDVIDVTQSYSSLRHESLPDTLQPFKSVPSNPSERSTTTFNEYVISEVIKTED